MEKKDFRKLTSRILRHSGFKVKINKNSGEYEIFDTSPQPILFCRPVIINEAEVIENYLCFRVENKLTETQEKLYSRMKNRFTRLAPSVNISFEDETEPLFSDEQLEKLDQLLTEYDTNEGENNDTQN